MHLAADHHEFTLARHLDCVFESGKNNIVISLINSYLFINLHQNLGDGESAPVHYLHCFCLGLKGVHWKLLVTLGAASGERVINRGTE